MLSAEKPVGSSCSSKLPSVTTNVRDSYKSLASQEGDPVTLHEITTPSFSIRDYVFHSRSKGIEASWPFAPQFLHLCLEHGVKDFLPPFEKPDLVRGNNISKVAEPLQPVASSELQRVSAHFVLKPTDGGPSGGNPASIQKGSGLTLEERVLDLLDRAIHPSQKDKESTSCRGLFVDRLSNSDVEIASASGTPQQTENNSSQIGQPLSSASLGKNCSQTQIKPGIGARSHNIEKACEPLEKKNRQTVKLGTILETCQNEDLVNNSSFHLHPMATKVCPVCKTFSFTSNTTLNAHIDQCLSMGSNSKEVLNDVPKYKVKLRKKRLMVDIYATAPSCTLEDLDKRNGTNWASELVGMAAATNGMAGHTKRPELSPTCSMDDGNETVYVDSDGVKVRILSKFNDGELSRENFKLRKHGKELKPSNSHLISKKKHFAAKHLKDMKLKALRKQLISFNTMKSEIQAAAEVDCDTENHQKNDKSMSHVPDSRDQDNSIASPTIKQWACSRRSDILRKLTKKDNCVTLEGKELNTGNMNLQPESGKSTDVRTQLKKFSRSSENLTCSPKRKRVNFLHDGVDSIDQRKRESLQLPSPSSRSSSEGISSSNGLILRLSRSSGSFTCSSIAKLKETHMTTHEEFGSNSNKQMILSNNCRSKPKDHGNSALKESVVVRRPLCLEARKVGTTEKPSLCKKLRKHRSVLRNFQKGESAPQSNNEGVCSPTNNICIPRIVENKILGSPRAYVQRNSTMPGEGEVMNEVSTRGINTTGYSNIMEEQKNNNLENPSSEAQCCLTEIETSCMQILHEISGSIDYGTKTSTGEVAHDPIAYDTTNSDKDHKAKLPLITQLNEEQLLSASEADAEQFKQTFKKQEKISVDGACSEMGNEEIEMAKVEGRKDCCTIQSTEYEADTPSVHESSGCLTSRGDVPQKSSSFNSIGITASHVKYLSGEGEASASPVSTASTILLPSPTGSKAQDAEWFSRGISARDNLNWAIPSRESIEVSHERKLEKNIKQDNKGSLQDKELDLSLDDKHTCCSCGENLSRNSELFRENGDDRTMKLKRLSNLSIWPRSSSSFTVYQNHKNNAVANTETRPLDSSVSAKSLLELAVKVPNSGNICSPSPSPQSQNHSVSSPILRLMGKNLMVVNSEELAQPQPTASDCKEPINISADGYALNGNHLKQGIFQYQRNQLLTARGSPPAFAPVFPLSDHQITGTLPGTLAGGFAWAQQQNGCITKPDQHTQQRRLHKRPNSSHHTTGEVIVIDDTPEHEMDGKDYLTTPASAMPHTDSGLSCSLSHRPFSCYPLQHQVRDYYPRPLFPYVYPSANSGLMNQGISLEGQGSFLPSSTLFQSPTGQRGPLIYYTRTLH
ncbi:hypothetical protein Cni_G21105 [Canna indica]|uniref:UBZ4-type domain-containing protein n=1 Tax=Canna indica TaxID=4628 RepID=A0AAQ3KPC0_9LILI|nr:hypothetical protein Cni_G21105 [Canna indica]